MGSGKRTRRRAAGDGSVYRDESGRWRGVADLGWQDGRRVRKYVRGATQSEVLEKLRKVQRAAAAGQVSDDRITVERFLDRWLEVNLPATVSESTLADYQGVVRLHLNPALGKRRLSQLGVADVDRFLDGKRRDGYSPNSLRIMRAVLRRALGQAEREGLVARNVAGLSQAIRIGQSKGRSMTVEQIRSLLVAAQGDRFEAGYLILFTYGLRRGELLGLAWSDLDEAGRRLVLRQGARPRKLSAEELDGEEAAAAVLEGGREGGVADASAGEVGGGGLEGGGHGVATRRVRLGDLKTQRSRRVVLLTEEVLRALEVHRVRQAAEREAVGALWEEWGLIFPSEKGTPMDPNNFTKRFTKLCEAAGLGRWSPHAARHSAASVMLQSGVPLEVVSEVLGHASISITKDVYGHLLDGSKKDAAERMADVILR